MTAREASEIVSTRAFAAPRDRVWRALADPAQLARWWGPAGFTNTFHEFDFRAGGLWRFTMRAPDGSVFKQLRKFIEVAPPEILVIENPDPAHRFRMTIELGSRGDGTRLLWRMAFESAEEFSRVKDFIVGANEENFDRLAALLAQES